MLIAASEIAKEAIIMPAVRSTACRKYGMPVFVFLFFPLGFLVLETGGLRFLAVFPVGPCTLSFYR